MTTPHQRSRSAESRVSFTAPVIKGIGKGKELGSPTINLDLSAVPQDLAEGVYAAFATIDDERFPATMHYGPRPTLGFGKSCEVHVLQQSAFSFQHSEGPIDVCVVQKIREVQDFGSEEALRQQIETDIATTKHICKNGNNGQ